MQSAWIQGNDSGIESHDSLSAGEPFKSLLRRIYRIVKDEHGSINPKECLALSVHAMNCTAGANGLASISFVFGVFPPIPT